MMSVPLLKLLPIPDEAKALKQDLQDQLKSITPRSESNRGDDGTEETLYLYGSPKACHEITSIIARDKVWRFISCHNT